MSRKNSQELVAHYKLLLEPFTDTPVSIQFEKFTSETKILDIYLAKTTGMINAPEKRQKEDGKWYVPAVMIIKTVECEMRFVLELLTFAAITNGIMLNVGATDIIIRRV